ncbi:geranylgeranylglyceryl/heptaprenylglyceryl phosphate synthase [Algibacter sp. Ld11]|uniref:geranylgeranylglyceryl/heptaprenylglyceryl phosphate synthase n=1 Tax=Algibacter sp. Ld11 TaxID=649150 RepID=UPI003863CAE7
MRGVYQNIQTNTKQLAVLIDPDKFLVKNTAGFIEKVNRSIATHIFVGGSIVDIDVTDILVEEIKKHTQLPIVLFPGDVTQITEKADAILFLSLISGRNPEYLIGKHVKSVTKLRNTTLEVISTGYILIESGKATAVQQVTQTLPLERGAIDNIVDTAKAAQLLGMKLIYLEAGSGARVPVSQAIIAKVKQEVEVPVIVGGGIRNLKQLENAYASGADLVVIGTAFEEDEFFFEALKK